MSKAYYPHILAQALSNLLDIAINSKNINAKSDTKSKTSG